MSNPRPPAQSSKLLCRDDDADVNRCGGWSRRGVREGRGVIPEAGRGFHLASRRPVSVADKEQASALEEVLRPYWSRSFGSRAFQFDAFLSHNQADNSGDLAVALRRVGAKVWRDDDSDMSDQRVRDRINKAINASRYLVVCVGPTFRDSEWVRAEYVPALLQARSHGFERVVVAKAPSGSLPDELEICRLFEWDNAAALAEFVSLGNRLPFYPEQLLAKFPRPKVMLNLGHDVRADLGRRKETIERLIHERTLSQEELVRGAVCATCLSAVEQPSRFQGGDFMLDDQLVPQLTKSIAISRRLIRICSGVFLVSSGSWLGT